MAPEDIFEDYAYFSAYSSSWVEHARRYTEQMIERFALGSESLVVELASNDGYLLQHFVERGVPSLGIDPAANVAEEASRARRRDARRVLRLRARRDASSPSAARQTSIVANNVLAQVPELNDFVAGIVTLLADDGVATIEVPHLVRLIEEVQFDTIYHEHYSYFSLTTLVRALRAARARDLRRRGAAVPRRLAPDLRHPRKRHDPRAHGPASAELLDRERGSGLHRARDVPELRRAV